MNFSTFTQNAIKTESVIMADDRKIVLPLFRSIIKLAIKTSQVADALKKGFFYNKKYSVPQLALLFNEIHQISGDIAAQFDALYGGSAETSGNPFAGDDAIPFNTRILHAILGYFTESGEMLEFLDKALDDPAIIPDYINLREEIGDVDWYKAVLFDAIQQAVPNINFNEEQIREMIIQKLKARYGDKFTEEAAENRDLSTERGILEEV